MSSPCYPVMLSNVFRHVVCEFTRSGQIDKELFLMHQGACTHHITAMRGLRRRSAVCICAYVPMWPQIAAHGLFRVGKILLEPEPAIDKFRHRNSNIAVLYFFQAY